MVAVTHIVLVIIWALRLEHNITISLERSGTVSTVIIVVAQALSVVRTPLASESDSVKARLTS